MANAKLARTRKPRLGSGKRFATLVRELEKNPNIKDPEGLAATIGRRKYGKRKFQQLSRHD